MSQLDNKVRWCLKKAEKELKGGDKHRGLVKTRPDLDLAQSHIRKAEHNLRAMSDFRDAGYSDWSASAAFYSIYHCFLAISAKFGYESRNQECTFALVRQLIAQKKISLDSALVDEVCVLETEETQQSPTVVDVRETGQYGISISLEDVEFNRLLGLAKKTLDKTKEIMIT